jgi:nicotinamidase-related amidase
MTTALLIIDMQMEMAARIASGQDHANPQTEERIDDLLDLFRGRGLEVIHVHHDQKGTPFARDLPSGAVIPSLAPRGAEKVFYKSTSSAFAGTRLEGYLRGRGIETLVIVGAVAAFCVTSTTRQAADLGFRVILPGDALLGFDLPAYDGGHLDAATVMRVTLSLLGADFARLVRADQVAALV